MRLVIELIEELVDRGGGYGLFTSCAAGDTGAALWRTRPGDREPHLGVNWPATDRQPCQIMPLALAEARKGL
jgi:hypothetical protein